MSLLNYMRMNKPKLSDCIPKQIFYCFYQTHAVTSWNRNSRLLYLPTYKENKSCIAKDRKLPVWEQVRSAGHSKWSNIKFKKMHIDNARAKVFGKLSLEIIQAVKESGPDPAHNPKLDGIILRAKAACMPKEKIETSIKNALRDKGEKHVRVAIEARGPGKCGLMIDVLSPNIIRCKHEIKGILKKNEGIFIEDGSVIFMFDYKGVLTVEAPTETVDSDAKAEAEDIAILIGAENVLFDSDEDRNIYHFICPPLELYDLQKNITADYKELKVLSAGAQYLAKSLNEPSEELMTQTDRLIGLLSDHPDVVSVYDNMKHYPSKTIKIFDTYG